jgi:hypothetical protein
VWPTTAQNLAAYYYPAGGGGGGIYLSGNIYIL